MTNLFEIYKCDVCKNIVEVVDSSDGILVCCDQNMKLLKPKTEDKGNEKHVPIIEKTDKGYKVIVGKVLHPMEDEHFIEWIELIEGKKSYQKFLKPKDQPIAFFETDAKEVIAREHCNIHGLWESSKKE